MLTRLLHVGFRYVGEWYLANKKLGFTLLSENDSRNLVFAFVSENEILYIGGITMSFKRLLYGYRKPSATQCSCAILNTLISGHLQDGGIIEIYALADHGLLHVGTSCIDIVSVLEDSLILDLKPKWNACLREI
jgi:hypothetical protein